MSETEQPLLPARPRVGLALGSGSARGWAHIGIIQALDGNVLVPLLFSEAVNLHPVSIIIAVLVFGSVWGFWGVFFAIPLATLIKAILNAWPKSHSFIQDDSGAGPG